MWLRCTTRTQAIWFYLVISDSCWWDTTCTFSILRVFWAQTGLPILLSFLLCVRTLIPNWLCYRRNRSWKRSSSWSDTSHGTFVRFFDPDRFVVINSTRIRRKINKDPRVFTVEHQHGPGLEVSGGSIRYFFNESLGAVALWTSEHIWTCPFS